MNVELNLQDIDDCRTAFLALAEETERFATGAYGRFHDQLQRKAERYRNLAMKFEVLMGDEYGEADEGMAEIMAHEECTDNDDF